MLISKSSLYHSTLEQVWARERSRLCQMQRMEAANGDLSLLGPLDLTSGGVLWAIIHRFASTDRNHRSERKRRDRGRERRIVLFQFL